MNIIKWKIGDTPPSIEGQLAVAIGNFDGIHKGHVKLLNECKLQANKSNLAFGVVTFDPHARDFFNPKNPSFKLLDHEEKERLLSKLGIEFLIIIIPYLIMLPIIGTMRGSIFLIRLKFFRAILLNFPAK